MIHVTKTGPSEADRKLVAEAFRSPHANYERFDPHFPAHGICDDCGKICVGPRALMREGFIAHWQEDCPMRHSRNPDKPHVMRIISPRQ